MKLLFVRLRGKLEPQRLNFDIFYYDYNFHSHQFFTHLAPSAKCEEICTARKFLRSQYSLDYSLCTLYFSGNKIPTSDFYPGDNNNLSDVNSLKTKNSSILQMYSIEVSPGMTKKAGIDLPLRS